PKHSVAAGVPEQARRQSAIGRGRQEWAKDDGCGVSVPAAKRPSGYRARRPCDDRSDRTEAKLNACEWASPRRPDRCDQTTARSTAERWRYPNSGACERSYKYSATGGEYPAKDQHCSQVDATGFDPAAGSGRATAKNP